MLDCVDEKLTKHIGKGGPLDSYVLAGDFVIDPERTAGSQIFRLLRQHHTVVIGEQLKEAVFKEKLVGPGLFALDGSRENLMPGFEQPRPSGGSGRKPGSRGKPSERNQRGPRR